MASSTTTSSSVQTNSALVSNNVVAASTVSVSASASASANGSKNSTSKNAAPGMVVNPVSWKYGFVMAAFAAGSFVLGAGI
ncbi:hypothetical protein SKDZ_13G2480 [Saccharomyces kudriavzevii ZP591]|uniref:Uncharacterized protein n=2 Tax=Saccharomyces kudriavzevii (strain ATCC MYA-4449 / AS 2.2408 / CBS 8840 / NBRC 1802 / NCYC 2889) TaxID=226230 RepID=A0AA35J6Y2_SACK1|nr:uncharacterized protein SKDI_13G2520 [Saccharomyces kudriavzevii IFO 1802]EJT43835.1 YMR122W-A-like protein [Saccharomyces kudriavzevii IFO 1802]CAI4048351.1 hypothetical protein SKDZ_13G2480 [Saccharomyces kudriavzevii ZP591]CAI4048353.1 hypothetical protein SKDI_13G2520 [Saccharomyces kudriavzevii IFO 1802]